MWGGSILNLYYLFCHFSPLCMFTKQIQKKKNDWKTFSTCTSTSLFSSSSIYSVIYLLFYLNTPWDGEVVLHASWTPFTVSLKMHNYCAELHPSPKIWSVVRNDTQHPHHIILDISVEDWISLFIPHNEELVLFFRSITHTHTHADSLTNMFAISITIKFSFSQP